MKDKQGERKGENEDIANQRTMNKAMDNMHFLMPLPLYFTHKLQMDWNATKAPANKAGRTLSFWCFSPGFAIHNLIQHNVHSLILTSASFFSEIERRRKRRRKEQK